MSLNPGSRGVLGRIVLVCGAITAGIGALVLAGWAIGWDALMATVTGYVPMAPNTALLFVLFGSALLAREIWPASRVIHRAAAATALFSAILGSVTLIGFVVGPNIDDWLFRTTRMLGAMPMGAMSPITAFCFVLAGISLLQLEWQARRWAAVLGTLIALAGAVCLMGFWFGAPLLYGGTITPMTLPMSLVLVALGAGLTAAAGPDTWPLNTLIGPSTRARLLRALLPAVVLLALINDWITAILLKHSDPGVVLASAISAISFLLVVGLVVSRVSRTIGDVIDRTQAERKRAEETQARLAAIVENSYDAIIGRTPEGTITSWNAAAERILGYTAAEAIGRELTEIQPPELRQEIVERRKLLLAGHAVLNYETVRIAKDGRHIDVAVSLSPIKDMSGNVVGTAATLRDISERKRIERELQHKTELARLLEQLARAANEAVSPEAAMENCLRRICEDGKWALGRVASFPPGLSPRKPDRSQWFCAEAARFDALMRYSDRLEFMGGPSVFINLALRDQRPVWLRDLTALDTAKHRRLAMAAEAGLKAAFAFPVIVRGEVAAFLEFFATETRLPDDLLIDGTTGLASQFARLIERHRSVASQARLAAIVEHSNDAIIGRAVDGTITSWNAAAERILGFAAAEVIGRDSVEIFPPEVRQHIAERRKLVTAGQLVRDYETVRITKDGRRIDVLGSIFAVKDTSGHIMGIASLLRDISERKRAEQILRDYTKRLQVVSRKLLEVQEDERRWLARELHDQVGQVLTALKINLQVIERQSAAAPVALKIKECARIADAALQQVRTLMLDLRPPQLDELGLAVALRAHAERLASPANLALHFTETNVPLHMPPAIDIVCYRVMQEALTNIMRHAGARNAWIDLAVTGDGLELTVRDDGKGFDLGEAQQRAVGGRSIGLLSMEERAALAGGRVEISTARGAGTTVRAVFALQAAQSIVDAA